MLLSTLLRQYATKLLVLTMLFTQLVCSCKQKEAASGQQNSSTKDSVVGAIILYDNSAAASIDRNARITIIGKGYNWAEGPVWLAKEQMLLLSDVPENKIYSWKDGDTPHVYLTPGGYTGKAPREGEIGSNGLALDSDGRLLICQSGNRQVARLNGDINNPRPGFTALAKDYKGKKFNSPNDLVADSHNNIYFTDPVYGLPQGENDATRELSFEGVYKISATGTLTLLLDSIPRPNGVALSPNENILYIASSDSLKPAWYAYKLDAQGNITSGGVLLNARPLKDKATVKQGPDGMKLDAAGNIFSAGPDGINIISPGGKLLGLIKIVGRKASNCAFNETKSVLYVTADDLVLKIVLHP